MYWGGAIFMLLADLEIRGRSQGRQGVEDCLREILREGGDATRVVGLDWMIDSCDRAIGGTTIRSLAQKHVWSQAPVDLAAIWRRLGIDRRDDGHVLLDDNASQEAKAQYPLREARIEVTEVPGKPGAFKSVAFLRPHYQLDELSVSLRLVAELPKSAR